MLITRLPNKTLPPSNRRPSLLAPLFVLNAMVVCLAQDAQAAPTAGHVYGGCQLSANSVNGLRADISLSSSNLLSTPQVDYVVTYTRDNPNHGQQLTAGPSTYSGPVVCNNVSVPQGGWLTSLEPVELNTALGNSADPLSITAMEQAQILQHVPAGAISLVNAENRFCHTAANHVDCFRVTPLPPPAPPLPVMPSADRVWGGCTLGPQAILGVESDMVSGGIPVDFARVDYLVVHSRGNPNDGQSISGTNFTGPILCINPNRVAVSQVQENTTIPPSVDLKGLNQSTGLQYVPTSGLENTAKKICHTAAGNTDCFLVAAAAPPPPPPPVFSAAQDFEISGSGLNYVASSWYGDGLGFGVTQDDPPGPNGRFMRLTPDAKGQLNMIAFDRINTGSFSRVVVDFDFRIIANPNLGNTRADGIGFAFLNTASNSSISGTSPIPVYEDTDLSMPIDSSRAIGLDSLQIGLDTFNNGAPNDPDNNHVSIIYNTASPNPGSSVTTFPMTGQIDLANGVFNHAHIEVVPSASGCNVTFTITTDSFNGGVALSPISVDIPLSPYNGRMIFGGRTGANQESHDIDNIRVTVTE